MKTLPILKGTINSPFTCFKRFYLFDSTSLTLSLVVNSTCVPGIKSISHRLARDTANGIANLASRKTISGQSSPASAPKANIKGEEETSVGVVFPGKGTPLCEESKDKQRSHVHSHHHFHITITELMVNSITHLLFTFCHHQDNSQEHHHLQQPVIHLNTTSHWSNINPLLIISKIHLKHP